MTPKRVTYSQRSNHAARAAHARGARQFKTYDTSYIRPKQSKGPIIAAVVVAIVLLIALIFGLSSCFGGNKNLLQEGESVKVEIPEGSSTQAIANILYDAGVINSKNEFTDTVSTKNAASSLKPGIYTFEGGVTCEEVVNSLVAGPGLGENSLSIPEGYTIESMGEAVQKAYAGSITKEDFISAAHNASSFADEFPFVAAAHNNTLEGFLFPKTYEVIQGYTAKDVIRQMLSQYQQEVATLDYSYPESLGYSSYDVLILASIVEKESVADTRSKVAAVFYNRLTNDGDPAYGMLGSDATTAYEIGGEPDNYDWNTDSPYNTRKTKGLPPTPICSPSLDCLQAVCSPEQNFSDYYFFSFWPDSNGKMQYYFDKTYEDHQATIQAHS